MALRVTAITLLLASFLALAAAQSVHLFGDTNFGLGTGHWLFEFSMTQFCINAVDFNDKASSAQWRGLAQTGSFPNNQAFIAFYTERNCTGTVRTWPTAEKDFPTNFALNGIDNKISSFMVWKTSSIVEGVGADPRSSLLQMAAKAHASTARSVVSFNFHYNINFRLILVLPLAQHAFHVTIGEVLITVEKGGRSYISIQSISTILMMISAANARALWEIKLMYALTNAGSSSISSFLTVYYQQTAGFSKAQIGVLQTLPNFSSVVAPPVWGAVADYIQDQRRIHVLCILTGTLFYFGIQFFSWSFGWTAIMVVMARFQRCPSGSLLDHAVLDVLEKVGGEYGKQRLFGAVGWGIGAYFTGLLVVTGGSYWSFWTQLVLWYSSLLVLQRIPPVKYSTLERKAHSELENSENGESRTANTRVTPFVESARMVTKELDVLVLLGVVFLMGLMYGVIASFLTLNLYNLSGEDSRIVGIVVLCQTSSELPAFFFANKIIMKIGTVKVLLISILGYAIRIAYYTGMTNAWGVIPFEFLHGVTFGLAWAACTQYIYSAAPRGCASTVMGVLNALQNGLARASGTLVGGYFYERYGPRTMWLVTGLGVPFSLVGLGIFAYLKGTADIQEKMLLEEAEIFTPHGANPQPMKTDGYGSCSE